MTTTKALAKLHKEIVGSEGKNSIAKNLESLAANWSLASAGGVPPIPSASGNYLLSVTSSGAAWIAATSSAIS